MRVIKLNRLIFLLLIGISSCKDNCVSNDYSVYTKDVNSILVKNGLQLIKDTENLVANSPLNLHDKYLFNYQIDSNFLLTNYNCMKDLPQCSHFGVSENRIVYISCNAIDRDLHLIADRCLETKIKLPENPDIVSSLIFLYPKVVFNGSFGIHVYDLISKKQIIFPGGSMFPDYFNYTNMEDRVNRGTLYYYNNTNVFVVNQKIKSPRPINGLFDLNIYSNQMTFIDSSIYRKHSSAKYPRSEEFRIYHYSPTIGLIYEKGNSLIRRMLPSNQVVWEIKLPEPKFRYVYDGDDKFLLLGKRTETNTIIELIDVRNGVVAKRINIPFEIGRTGEIVFIKNVKHLIFFQLRYKEDCNKNRIVTYLNNSKTNQIYSLGDDIGTIHQFFDKEYNSLLYIEGRGVYKLDKILSSDISRLLLVAGSNKI